MLKRVKRNFPTEFRIAVETLQNTLRRLYAIANDPSTPKGDQIRALRQIADVAAELFRLEIEGLEAWKAAGELEGMQ